MFQIIAEGLQFPESPFWSARDGCVYFVEWNGDRAGVIRQGKLERLFGTEQNGGPSGLAQDAGGNFWVCLYTARKLVQYSPAGRLLQAVVGYNNVPFKGPNDLVLDARGTVYFTDGGDYEEDWRTGRPAGAVYSLSLEGRLTLLDQGLCFPNGIALSPDEKSLYVAEHRQNRILRYMLLPGGSASERELFYRLDDACLLDPSEAFELGPDGLCVDSAGCLWVAHYGGGKLVQVAPDGELLRSLYLPRGRRPSNSSYQPEKNVLYVTEAELGLLYRVDLSSE